MTLPYKSRSIWKIKQGDGLLVKHHWAMATAPVTSAQGLLPVSLWFSESSPGTRALSEQALVTVDINKLQDATTEQCLAIFFIPVCKI